MESNFTYETLNDQWHKFAERNKHIAEKHLGVVNNDSKINKTISFTLEKYDQAKLLYDKFFTHKLNENHLLANEFIKRSHNMFIEIDDYFVIANSYKNGAIGFEENHDAADIFFKLAEFFNIPRDSDGIFRYACLLIDQLPNNNANGNEHILKKILTVLRQSSSKGNSNAAYILDCKYLYGELDSIRNHNLAYKYLSYASDKSNTNTKAKIIEIQLPNKMEKNTDNSNGFLKPPEISLKDCYMRNNDVMLREVELSQDE
ncbi:7722_t:CDS:2, partial [Scutellospora calospora]